ncbi:MAG: hypothetical protein M3Q81_02205 [bacterium]|nr:hypothetical protein [bacterium]
MQNSDFVAKLQQEAQLQARLNQEHLIPSQLDWLTSFIGRYSWQVILLSSGVTALLLKLLTE